MAPIGEPNISILAIFKQYKKEGPPGFKKVIVDSKSFDIDPWKSLRELGFIGNFSLRREYRYIKFWSSNLEVEKKLNIKIIVDMKYLSRF